MREKIGGRSIEGGEKIGEENELKKEYKYCICTYAGAVHVRSWLISAIDPVI